MLAGGKVEGEIELSGDCSGGAQHVQSLTREKSGMTRETDHKLVSLGCSTSLQAQVVTAGSRVVSRSQILEAQNPW